MSDLVKGMWEQEDPFSAKVENLMLARAAMLESAIVEYMDAGFSLDCMERRLHHNGPEELWVEGKPVFRLELKYEDTGEGMLIRLVGEYLDE